MPRLRVAPDVLFARFLAERGLRLTPQRRLVLARAFADRGHFDAERLYDSLCREGCAVSRATVYRTLALLVQSNLVGEMPLEGRAGFEQAVGQRHHDHLICLGCGRIMEFHEPAIERLQEAVCRRNQFAASSHSLQIRGLCVKCAAQRRRSEQPVGRRKDKPQ